jgi:23S rRNA pseudouridine1911/1915/1917 synthase
MNNIKMQDVASRIVYEDNHVIIVNKLEGELVQGDKTGDITLAEKIKQFLKEKYNKPGNVFLGVTHRLDRPVRGLVMYAKTSKALSRLNTMFKKGDVHKTYLAITEEKPFNSEGILVNYLKKNEKQNKSYVYDKPIQGAKEAKLKYRVIGSSERYHLLEIELLTGRHHQIRAQLSHTGCVIKGDLKYGAKRSNKDGGIDLLAYKLEFVHPVKKDKMVFKAPLPETKLWQYFKGMI